jgi:phospholipase D1/2
VLHNFIHLIEVLKGNPFSLPIFVGLYAMACFLVPVSLFPVAGGVLFGFRDGLVINLVSVLLGATGPFFIARRLGQHALTRFFSRWHNRDAAARLRNPSPWGFMVIRLLGFPPFVVTNYLAGLSHMRYRRFLWTSAVGLLPWTFVMTFFADTFWVVLLEAGMEGFQKAVMHHARPLLGGAVLLVGVLMVGYLVNRRSKKKIIPPVQS